MCQCARRLRSRERLRGLQSPPVAYLFSFVRISSSTSRPWQMVHLWKLHRFVYMRCTLRPFNFYLRLRHAFWDFRAEPTTSPQRFLSGHRNRVSARHVSITIWKEQRATKCSLKDHSPEIHVRPPHMYGRYKDIHSVLGRTRHLYACIQSSESLIRKIHADPMRVALSTLSISSGSHILPCHQPVLILVYSLTLIPLWQ